MTDDELTALALAADPDAPIDLDAIPLGDYLRSEDDDRLLPEWYMPAPMPGARRLRGWRRRVAILVIVAFVLIDAYGLCSTYGSVVFA
ncbi:MAG: hypothetical protein QOI95_4277 [Acidimicrobiaceae bacterium]|jgi:hypothetical protein